MDNMTSSRKLAVVTGASTGIGYELARCCAADGYDLLIAADEPEIERAASRLEQDGTQVETVQADLSTTEGVDALLAKAEGRRIDIVLANAGRSLGHAFLDQDFADIRKVVDTNIVGTIYLLHKVGQQMRSTGAGKILITGSIAGFMPGPFQAVYNGSKAFLDSFSYALRDELKDSGVTVTCLMPGATETEIFERADMQDTKIARAKKDDPAEVARKGYQAMQDGDGQVITGLLNKMQVAAAHVMPAEQLAKLHRGLAEPGTGS